jgi:hypothetical protein
MPQKPINIYTEIIDEIVSTTSSTTKGLQWDKPEGWDKKPPLKEIKVVSQKTIQPAWVHDLKIISFSVIFTLLISNINGDKSIDYIISKYNSLQKKQAPVVIIDTIYQMYEDTVGFDTTTYDSPPDSLNW